MIHYLITGGAGFIGSHLAETLLQQGDYVTIVDDLSTGRFENIDHVTGHPSFRFAMATIMNEVVMDRLVSECDVVVHLAAAVGVELILRDPVQVIETNILGTHAVLRVANCYRKKVLIASTSEIYGKNQRVPFREDDDRVLGSTTVSRWSYSSSKAVDEFLALAYHRQMCLPVVIFRLFNTVGPRQTGRYGMVVPRFVQQALAGEQLTVHGDGSQARCFLHVKDAVSAIVALASCPAAIGHVFNIGSTEEVTILELAQRVLQHTNGRNDGRNRPDRRSDGRDAQIKLVQYEEAYGPGFEDMQRRIPDITKIYEYVGWKPGHGLDEILRDVFAYYSERPSAVAKLPQTSRFSPDHDVAESPFVR